MSDKKKSGGKAPVKGGAKGGKTAGKAGAKGSYTVYRVAEAG